MAQSTGPTHEPDDDSPAERLVRLLEEHGLEHGLRSILASLEARRLDEQREVRRRFLDEYLLNGEPPASPDELAQARRECEA
jgi:hypothetical protein